MKKPYLFLTFLSCSVSYSQSDEIKLWNQDEPLYGKVIIVKSFTIEFKQDTTGFLFEFNRDDVNYIKTSMGDTLWFNYPAAEKTNSENYQKNLTVIVNNRFTLFFSYNFSGTHESSLDSASASLDVNAGISLGAEVDILKIAKESVKLGLGVMYQFPRKPENINGDFNFIPLYAFIKLGLLNEEKVKLYVCPTLGYNFFNGDNKYSGSLDLKGGLYNSIGLGLLVRNKLDIKLLYQFNRGSTNSAKEVVYTAFNLNFGYYF